MIQHNVPVTFDAKNKDHRNAFYIFNTKHTWGKTNIRFILEQPFVDIPSMIQSKLLQYYMSNEFKKEKV